MLFTLICPALPGVFLELASRRGIGSGKRAREDVGSMTEEHRTNKRPEGSLMQPDAGSMTDGRWNVDM